MQQWAPNEVPINDAPAGVRTHLLKKSTQNDIERRTGTVIVTRGRFITPGAPHDAKDAPLHLFVRPSAVPGQVRTCAGRKGWVMHGSDFAGPRGTSLDT